MRNNENKTNEQLYYKDARRHEYYLHKELNDADKRCTNNTKIRKNGLEESKQFDNNIMGTQENLNTNNYMKSSRMFELYDTLKKINPALARTFSSAIFEPLANGKSDEASDTLYFLKQLVEMTEEYIYEVFKEKQAKKTL